MFCLLIVSVMARLYRAARWAQLVLDSTLYIDSLAKIARRVGDSLPGPGGGVSLQPGWCRESAVR